MSALYEKDFYGWCEDQARLLRENTRDNISLDFENLAEEIHDLGENKRYELVNALTLLFMHILKWEYQPSRRSPSWLNTIKHRRVRINRILNRNPSLRPQLPGCVDEAYEDARFDAAEETQLTIQTFPDEREFTVEWALNGEIE